MVDLDKDRDIDSDTATSTHKELTSAADGSLRFVFPFKKGKQEEMCFHFPTSKVKTIDLIKTKSLIIDAI